MGGGRIVFEYNGLWNDPACGWWLVEGGAPSFGYTGLYNDPACGWWLVGGGRVVFEYNGLWSDPACGWWLVEGGMPSFGYTGLYDDPGCGWWLVGGGRVVFEYNGLWNDPACGWWLVEGGTPSFGYTGLYDDPGCGWWLVNSGTVDFDYNGRWDDPVYGSWMITGGAVSGGVSDQQDYNDSEEKDHGTSQNFTYDEGDAYYKYEYAYKTGDTSLLSENDMIFYQRLKACLDTAVGTPFEKELAVHDWLVLNCAYDYDNYQHNTIPWESYSPRGLFCNGKAVCQGYAESFKLCMDILGIPCVIVTGTGNGGAHAWNAVELDGEWYMVDVTWDDPVPDTPGRVGYAYLNLTDEKMSRDHAYTSSVTANGTKYYYYAQQENYFTSEEIDAYYDYVNKKLSETKEGEPVHVTVELVDGSSFFGKNGTEIARKYMDGKRLTGYSSCSAEIYEFVLEITWH